MKPGAIRSRVSALCLALPEVVETAGQHSKFDVRGKTVAYFLDDHHGDGRLAINVKAAPGVQGALVAQDPDRYHVPAYLGPRGWVGMYLDAGPVDWDEVADLIEESYRLVAPKRLVALLDPR